MISNSRRSISARYAGSSTCALVTACVPPSRPWVAATARRSGVHGIRKPEAARSTHALRYSATRHIHEGTEDDVGGERKVADAHRLHDHSDLPGPKARGQGAVPNQPIAPEVRPQCRGDRGIGGDDTAMVIEETRRRHDVESGHGFIREEEAKCTEGELQPQA